MVANPQQAPQQQKPPLQPLLSFAVTEHPKPFFLQPHTTDQGGEATFEDMFIFKPSGGTSSLMVFHEYLQ
jgi:hypothetical protein